MSEFALQDRRRERPQAPIARPLVAVSRPFLPADALTRLPKAMAVRTWPERRPPTPAELLELARDAHGLLCLHTERIDANFVRSCPNLVAVSTLGVGFEHLDLEALAAEGVVAANTPGVLEEATADMTWALILATARQVVQADRFVREGLWQYPDLDLFVGPDLAGATLGIVGYGRVGRAVGRRSVGFRMRVLHYNVHQVPDGGLSKACDLNELAEQSDIVTVHLSLTAQTRGLIGAEFFGRMQKHAIFVNASRGAVVDQDALVDALSGGRILGAGLDVQAVEPVPAGDALLALRNCTVLPHIASASFGARRAMAQLAVDNLVAALEGRAMATPLVRAAKLPGSS